MKKIWKVLKFVLIGILVLILGLTLTGHGFLFKGIWATYLHGFDSANIDDMQFFDTRTIETSDTRWEWPLHDDFNKNELSIRLSESLKETESVAFLVIKNDSIINEYYWNEYSAQSHTNSFSMAKSMVSMLTQIAIQKGILDSWNQKVSDYYPELSGEYAHELELWHLATMSSGMHWDEHYKNPMGVTARAYYGNNISKLIESLPIDEKPGQKFKYQSGSPQLLAMVLTKASGKTLSELVSKWLWKPLQAENEAYWHLDNKEGMELAYCCFNSNARDFARFGKLTRNMGNWNGNQILDSSYVAMATKGQLAPQYGYAFWVYETADTKVYYQRGILGQYIISIPEYGLNIVRLGHHRGPHVGSHAIDFTIIVEEMIKAYGTK